MSNLVAQYHLNEAIWNGTPNEVIDSVGGLHGVALGTINTAIGKLNRCADGPGTTGNYVEIPDNIIDLTKDFSLEYLVNPVDRSTTSYYRCVSLKDTVNDLVLQTGTGSTDKIYFRIGEANPCRAVSNAVNITYDAWNHLVFAYTASTNSVVIYKNAAPLSTVASGPTSETLTASAICGAYSSLNQQALVDEVRFYDKTLTQGEITNLYNDGNGTETYENIGFFIGVSP